MSSRESGFRLTPVLIACAAMAATTSCGLFKRGDATDPSSLSLLKKFALAVPPMDATNLVRDSTQVLKVRMTDLFPGIQKFAAVGTYTNGAYVYLFNDADWDPYQASGVAASFGAESRPTDSVAIGYWNKRAFTACDWYLGGQTTSPDSAAAGAIFSKADVLMDGETLPDLNQNAATYWAFLAARNGFLYPYTADSPEVQTLAKAYTQALSDTTVNTDAWKDPNGAYIANRAPEQLARLAVCVATLSAPQFLIGNPSKTDLIRKLAYSLGYRRPQFKEISDFVAGKLNLSAWIAQLQTTEGYFNAMGRWHQDWLGLRPFNPEWGFFISGQGRAPHSVGAYFASMVADPRNNFGNLGLGMMQTASFSYFSDDYTLVYPFHYKAVSVQGQLQAPPSAPKIAISYGASSPLEKLKPLTSESGDWVDSLQDFDPRTAIVSYEYAACPASGQFVPDSNYLPKAVFVLKSAYDTQLAAVQATLPGFPFDANHCKLSNPHYEKADFRYDNNATEADYTAGGQYASYYFCKTDDSATYIGIMASQGLNGNFFGSVDATADAFSGEIQSYYGCNGAYLTSSTYDNPYFGKGTQRPVLRVRRFSPEVAASGGFTDQNGLSTVKTWFANEPVLASNTIHRFLLTCAFRPGPEFAAFKAVWAHASASYRPFVGDFIVPTDFTQRNFSFASNPYILNQFRCGNPNLAALNTNNLTQAVNDAAFPFAYNYNPLNYASGKVAQTSLNSVINIGGLHSARSYTTTPNPKIPLDAPDANNRFDSHLYSNNDEASAMLRLQTQIENEPMNLVRYVLKNHLSYKEILTARYTVGGPELELYYRTQGYFLPAYPDPNAAKAVTAAQTALDPSQYYKIELADYTSLRANYLHLATQSTADGTLPQNPVTGTYYYMQANDAPQFAFSQNASLPPRAGAGILTMPALLSPMTVTDVSLRSVAHRIYARLLCGEPNVVTLTASEQATHAKYLQSAANPTDVQHINSSTSCYQCHINMDPLASALGFNFLDTVLTPGQTNGSFGELYAPNKMTTSGRPMNYLLGVRAGPFRGSGAFLGKEILPDPKSSGFQQVGQILADDSRFGKCLTTRAFQKLFGRSPTFAEVPVLNSAAQHFMADGGDFDKLIQDLAVSAAYDKDN